VSKGDKKTDDPHITCFEIESPKTPPKENRGLISELSNVARHR
jgi:hypothetical protein